MMKKISIALILALFLGMGYGCNTKKQGCDCPTFGNHATGKSGVYKKNASNRKHK